MLSIIHWKTPIKADWHRATELLELNFGKSEKNIKLVEEDTEQVWMLTFESVQACKITSEECISIANILPSNGGFFKILDSPWLNELGKGSTDFLDKVEHYVICCYDEIIEVACTNPTFVKTDDLGYPELVT